ncbi:hypothetical protein ND991_03625 [Gordonia sputi]|uniref:hypothetical protein n=1 Tax=Gordonia sputi TaxID=36823 RepID=UPI0020449D75|nr:hypothetical protein [Gordonia sputi]MCM3894309.1 hypothetical protein [Gordonia sputi]
MLGDIDYPATRSAIVRAGLLVPSPQFATADWLALQPTDPQWLASIARAALAWAHETDQLPTSLAEQLRSDDDLARERLKTVATDLSVAADWAAEARRLRNCAEWNRDHPDLRRRTA